jgi:hypothetical protein
MGFSDEKAFTMQSVMNEPPEDQELTKALDRMIADHVTGQPTRIVVPVLIDVLTVFDRCLTPV